MMKSATALMFCLVLVLVYGLTAAEAALWEDPWADEAPFQTVEEGETVDALSPFALSLKLGWHWFWRMGALATASMFPYYDFSVGDMQGFTGELDFDWFFRDYLVFTATLGGYQANLSQYVIGSAEDMTDSLK